MKMILLLILITGSCYFATHYQPIDKQPSPAVFKARSNERPNTHHKPVPILKHTIDRNYRVNKSALVTVNQLNKTLKGVLAGKGRLITDRCNLRGLDPLFAAAVMIHESGNGSSKYARTLNNVAGIYDGKNKTFKRFSSVDACIIDTIDMLAGKNYAGGKYQTVGAIQRKYCPVGAANDPKGLNDQWLSGVLGWMKRIAENNTVLIVDNN